MLFLSFERICALIEENHVLRIAYWTLPYAAHRWRKRGWSSTCNMVAAGRCRRLSAMNSPITVHPAKPDSLDMPALVGEGGRHAGQHNHPHPHGTVWKLQWRDSALSPVTRSSGHAPGDALINRLGAYSA